jgi:hypothetical protein
LFTDEQRERLRDEQTRDMAFTCRRCWAGVLLFHLISGCHPDSVQPLPPVKPDAGSPRPRGAAPGPGVDPAPVADGGPRTDVAVIPDVAVMPDAAAIPDVAVMPDAADLRPLSDASFPDLPVSSGLWRHPGVLVNARQLAFVRERVHAGDEPWRSAFEKARASEVASLSWSPRPRALVECGASSTPNLGCSDERQDALAAYTHALLWNMTGDEAHARKAIEIMDAWSAVLMGHTMHNAPLQGGWAAAPFSRAAELMRWTYGGWPAPSVDRFARMLRTAYEPTIGKTNGGNGNWELVMIEASIGVAVFTEDRALFDRAVAMWKRRVPAYVYLTADGPLPVPPPAGPDRTASEALANFWKTSVFQADGQAQETCRDFGHTSWGIAAAINTAETALQQGVDLYAVEGRRLRAGLELHAAFINGAPVPPWLCGGRVRLATLPFWEIAFNHFATRLQMDLPHTRALIEAQVRPSGSNYFIAWETLTHAQVGWVGLR